MAGHRHHRPGTGLVRRKGGVAARGPGRHLRGGLPRRRAGDRGSGRRAPGAGLAQQDPHRRGDPGAGRPRRHLRHRGVHHQRGQGLHSRRGARGGPVLGGRRRPGAVHPRLHRPLGRAPGPHRHHRPGRAGGDRAHPARGKRHQRRGGGRRVPLSRGRARLHPGVAGPGLRDRRGRRRRRRHRRRRRRADLEAVFRHPEPGRAPVGPAGERRLRLLPGRAEPPGQRQSRGPGPMGRRALRRPPRGARIPHPQPDRQRHRPSNPRRAHLPGPGGVAPPEPDRHPHAHLLRQHHRRDAAQGDRDQIGTGLGPDVGGVRDLRDAAGLRAVAG